MNWLTDCRPQEKLRTPTIGGSRGGFCKALDTPNLSRRGGEGGCDKSLSLRWHREVSTKAVSLVRHGVIETSSFRCFVFKSPAA
jgi:hypothetical protein